MRGSTARGPRDADRGVEGLDAQVVRLGAQPDAQLVDKDPLDLVDLAQGAGAVPAGQHRPGESEMRLLVPGVERHQLGPAPAHRSSWRCDSLQPPPVLHGPALVEVVRQRARTEQASAASARPGSTDPGSSAASSAATAWTVPASTSSWASGKSQTTCWRSTTHPGSPVARRA